MHRASIEGRASACQLLCALDGVDQNAVINEGATALDVAIRWNRVDTVRALLEFNVDTSEARVPTRTEVEILQLLDEQRKRSVNNGFSISFH